MVSFPVWLPCSDGSRTNVEVIEVAAPFIRSADAGLWMERVQRTHIDADTDRADRGWDWEILIPATLLAGVRRRPRLFQLRAVTARAPCAMVALLEAERWIDDQGIPSAYLWYVSGAPRAALAAAGSPGLVSAAARDIAITISLNGEPGGRLWLHAAPAGGQRLMDWYASRGLKNVAQNIRLPGPALMERRNDGRYFCLDHSTARAASRLMDEYRR